MCLVTPCVGPALQGAAAWSPPACSSPLQLLGQLLRQAVGLVAALGGPFASLCFSRNCRLMCPSDCKSPAAETGLLSHDL